jgi:hypothetical protein
MAEERAEMDCRVATEVCRRMAEERAEMDRRVATEVDRRMAEWQTQMERRMAGMERRITEGRSRGE